MLCPGAATGRLVRGSDRCRTQRGQQRSGGDTLPAVPLALPPGGTDPGTGGADPVPGAGSSAAGGDRAGTTVAKGGHAHAGRVGTCCCCGLGGSARRRRGAAVCGGGGRPAARAPAWPGPVAVRGGLHRCAPPAAGTGSQCHPVSHGSSPGPGGGGGASAGRVYRSGQAALLRGIAGNRGSQSAPGEELCASGAWADDRHASATAPAAGDTVGGPLSGAARETGAGGQHAGGGGL